MRLTLLALLLTIGLGAAFATTTDELQLTAGGLTATISDNGLCSGAGCAGLSADLNIAPGTTLVVGTIGGWNIFFTSGTSSSPAGFPSALDLGALTATCVGGPATCSSTPLDIQFSDINFGTVSPFFVEQYSATLLGGSGSTTQKAYVDSSNTLFAETTLIGTIGPFTGTNSGVVQGGSVSNAPYSLTLDEMFTATGTGFVQFSVDGSLNAVPEPGALVLFGSVLVLCSSKLRRHRAS
jgi:hypothetical protein